AALVPSALAQRSVSRGYDIGCTPTYPTGGSCPSIAIADSPSPNVAGPAAEMTLTIPSDPDGNTILEVIPRVWIQHTYQGDLRIQLIGPTGTTVTLVNRPGTVGPGSTVTGFSADDYGGFHQCLPGGGQYGFDPIFFRDQGFNPCTTSPYTPN